MDFKNARPWPQSNRNPMVIGKNTVPGKSKFIADRVNSGMITTIDPADIPPSALQMCRNARVRFDVTKRRPGLVLLTPTKPNSNSVIGMMFFKKNDGNSYYLRFSPTTIHERTGGSWTNYTAGAGGSLLGGAFDYIQAAVILDRLVFANNGVDVLQEADITAKTYKALGNAPKYKYITGFFNRVVGANLVALTNNGAQIGWSADGVPTEWDPLVNETAGSSPLVDSPGDLADFITGVFGFTNVMVVLREKSIWLANKQAIPSNPFYFYNAFPGVGCDCPYSAAITQNSITWADRRTGTIWSYTPGAEPIPIGRPIENHLFDGLSDSARIFGSADPIQNEYTVCIPQVSGNFVICWTWNFRTQSWDKDEYEAITIASNADLPTAVTTIDELPGTIDGLSGTIDSLSPTQINTPVRAFGRSDGEIVLETQDDNLCVDPPFSGSLGTYQTELLSKSYTLPSDDVYIAEIRVDIIPRAAGAVTFEYSKDGGKTLNTVSKTIVIPASRIGKPTNIHWIRQIKCRKYAWRLTASTGQFDVVAYEVHVYKSGESQQ